MRFASFHSARSAYERREKSGMPGRLVISGLPSLSGIFQHSIAYLRVAGRVITRKITESRDPDLKENRCAWINFPSPCIASFEYDSSLVKQISFLQTLFNLKIFSCRAFPFSRSSVNLKRNRESREGERIYDGIYEADSLERQALGSQPRPIFKSLSLPLSFSLSLETRVRACVCACVLPLSLLSCPTLPRSEESRA